MRKQIHLEAIRGLAACIVVLAHFAAAFYPSTLFGSKYPAHESWESLFTTTPLGLVFAGHFAVCVFFILSGYVLSIPYFGDTEKGTAHLLGALVKRPFRLGCLVLLSILTSFFLYRCGGYFNEPVSIQSFSIPWFQGSWAQNEFTFERLILDVTTRLFSFGWSYNPPLWTLKVELYGSFLTFMFLLLFRRSNLRLLAYLYAFFAFQDTLYHGFIIGIILADIVCNFPHVVKSCSRSALAWSLLAVGLLLSSYPEYRPTPELADTFYGMFPKLPGLGGGYSMLGATIVFAAVLLNPRLQAMLSGSTFAFIGRISYALYAFHFLLLGSFTSWLFLEFSPHFTYNVTCALVGIISLGVMLVLSFGITKFIDEPATRGANQLAKIWLRSTDPVTSRTSSPFADEPAVAKSLAKRCGKVLVARIGALSGRRR